MAGITQTIPQYALGMSEQSDSLKFPGQVKEVTNAIPDVTKGLFKRPGLKRVDTSAISDGSRTVSTDEGKLKDLQDNGAYFHYFRDETEGSYIGQIASDGEVRVWRCSDGKKMTVNYGTGGATALKAYLTTSDPENLQTLTINDTTFVCNRDVTRSQTAVGLTGSTDARPDDHFALIELLRAENGRQYGLNITNGTDDASRNVTLKRATRIRIKSQTLNESTGGGECLGIGTEVFDITARIDRPEQTGTDIDTYRLPTAAISTTNNRFGPLSNHGYENDQAFIYHSPGSVITGLTNNRDYYIRDKNANGFDLSQAPGSQSSTINIQSSGDNNQILIPAEKGIVLNSSGNVVTDGSKKNLVFRISTLGQQGNADNSPNDFICSYQPEVTLLHGGEGWETGDKIIVGMTGQGFGGGGKNSDGDDLRIALYTLEITDHEETVVQAKYGGAETGLIRPAVTPFDSDTTVTSDTILAGMKTAIEGISGSPINVKIIGTTMYLSSTSTFNIEVVEEDLMRVMQDSTNEVTNLPNQCKHGYIVQVKNARMADEDDYYLRFDGQNDKDGAGAWSECAKPGIDKNFTNMPIVIQRTSVAETFEVRQFEYEDRRVGDNNTNPLPSFISRDSNNNFNGRINKVLFFRNRLAFLSGENVILSRPGTLGKPDFFVVSALTTAASDPIDISAASMFPSELFDGIEISAGLVVFSTNQQFILTSDDTVLNPDTAKLKSISTFNYNKNIPPISLGTTLGYIDNSGRFSRLNEMANVQREGEPDVVEVSKTVPTLLPKEIDLLTNSRENSIILIGKSGSNEVLGYKYLNIADKRQQAAWFKWKFNRPIKYHFIINDEYFVLDTDKYLQTMRIVETENDLSITQEDVNYPLHLDNYVPLHGGTYTANNNTTTFTGVDWLDQISNTEYSLAVIDAETGTNNDRLVRYQAPGSDGTTLTLTGDWATGVTSSNPLHVGYVYDYEVKFPTFFPTRTDQTAVRSDINSSLVLHRIKLHFGKIGQYRTTLKRVGKPDYTEIYESSILDNYDVNAAPYLEEYIKTVPVYERNVNVDVILKSTHPAPATLLGLSWEGDYSPRFYKRV
jgi:hypothetical protein